MKRLACLLWLCACEPSLQGSQAIRNTVEAQVAPGAPGPVREQAAAARSALGRWKGPANGELSSAIEDAVMRLSLVEQPSSDLELSVARFGEAAARITAGPLDAEGVASVRALLAQSREAASLARARVPTVVSPTSSLKAVRRHQGEPEAPPVP